MVAGSARRSSPARDIVCEIAQDGEAPCLTPILDNMDGPA
jgi:hypothetical protein